MAVQVQDNSDDFGTSHSACLDKGVCGADGVLDSCLGFCHLAMRKLTDILHIIKVACVPSTAEIIIAIPAVVVLLIVAIFEYRQERKKIDLFSLLYVPYTDKILEYMNIAHYHDWTYSLAVSGNTMVHEDQLDRWDDLVLYI